MLVGGLAFIWAVMQLFGVIRISSSVGTEAVSAYTQDSESRFNLSIVSRKEKDFCGY